MYSQDKSTYEQSLDLYKEMFNQVDFQSEQDDIAMAIGQLYKNLEDETQAKHWFKEALNLGNSQAQKALNELS